MRLLGVIWKGLDARRIRCVYDMNAMYALESAGRGVENSSLQNVFYFIA